MGDQNTVDGGAKRDDSSQNRGDPGSFVDGPGMEDTKSLRDQATFGDAGGNDEPFDDGMEVVDLSARYIIVGTLGKGGMGEVLLALDTRLKRKVAIKRVLGKMARSQTALSRFSTEAQSIAALNHPNIVQIHDYGRDEDGPFLIMEYVDGGSLLEKCKEGALELEEAVELSCQLCDGLGMAHEAGIIHRDIKPDNVLLTNDGTPKLTDFGLARQDTADHGQTQVGTVLGTIDFMPPEQRRGATQTDARSDLWSLAATLYQMLTGKSPKIIKFNNVPQALQDVLGKALEDEKDDRYQTAREFRDALRASQKLQAAPEPAAELGAGECPKCHTRNEASRKFCSESECAASLRVKCLKCEAEIPVWDKVCAECGGKQIELAEARRAELDTAREKAESLRSEYAFDESLRIAREIAAVEDSRLQHLKEWSETFIDETETEKERQEQNAANHYAEAKTHREAYDYKSAIHAMETIPEAMRTSGMSSYLQQLQSDHDESEELITTIPDQVKPSVLKGLLEQVERAVELRGDHADLLKLQTQLNERLEKLIKQRDAAYTEAASLLNEGQAKKAYRQIRRVKTQDLRASDVKLRTQLEEIVAAEDALTALVEESKADGVLDPDEVAAMWKSTDEYLKLNPRHEKIAEMQQQLVDRIERAPAEYAAVLSELPAAVLSKLPAAVLSKLPANVLTQLPANVLTQLPPRKNTIGMQFKLWPGGTFTMGEGNETPHPVTLTKPFELGVYEVTQEQYEQVMKVPNRSKFKGPQNPVEKVSWDDAVEFCRKLSELPSEKAAGYVYRLPTEAEWEYACRAGTQTAYNFGDSESELGDYAWYDKNAGGTTHPVGSKKPNAWGLYDMHGNVYEWCQDWYGSYPSGSVTDPTGAASGSYRVLRGGSWDYHSGSCRSAYRSRYSPGRRSLSLGFRVLRSSIK